MELFRRYPDHMAHHLSGVVFPVGATATEVRKAMPILFLAIMAASSSEMRSMQRMLVKEMMQMFTDNVVIRRREEPRAGPGLQVAVILYRPLKS